MLCVINCKSIFMLIVFFTHDVYTHTTLANECGAFVLVYQFSSFFTTLLAHCQVALVDMYTTARAH